MSGQAWVTLIVGVVGFGGVIITLWQRDRADRRVELWRRLTWAFEQTAHPDAAAVALGIEAVGIVGRSALVSRDEKSMTLAFMKASLGRASDADDNA